MTMTTNAPRLTSLSHGGGCGCKIAPGLLSEILKGGNRLPLPLPPELLVGIETADDAAVYKLNDEQALIATTDFFMPIVDDPYDFGRIAATNAISDVYAMGGRPIMALALVGMPINVLPAAVIARILEGGEAVCHAAGIPIAGGHSIDSAEPIYGLVALGLVHPKLVKRNADARTGDRIILGKPLGVGILSAALKKDVPQGDLLRGAVDAASAMWFNEYHLFLNSGLNEDEVTVFFFDKHGLNFPEDSIICLEETWRTRPELCRKFVAATLEGWRYVLSHREEAVETVMKRAEKAQTGTNRSHQRWMLDRMCELIQPVDQGIAMGELPRDAYERVARELKSSGQLKTTPAFEDFHAPLRP